ncbi:Putative type II secretion system protein K [Pseudidiomarina piscicola]|uniref:Type II secretion system protein K n=1 Tax=Pseudidiomarina piscicola TaxID=2614830 RepID=A0A6S6WM96_9GAMM|nr:type II secretion system minor pseudopilin GspK [Pseudidiomarina piscicola]CAB0151157.1 Putative type II secretion system protein K [Pseudidiomarina piscicola]VZT40663.1 Putative type II secretion system protein K [Pseudomonas aeruginosa]
MNPKPKLSQLPNYRPQRQQGVALIMVLLVVALVTVLAVQLNEKLQMNVVRTMNYQQTEQAYWYMLSAEEIARNLLQVQLKDSDGVVHQDQIWHQQSEEERVYPIEGGGLVRVDIKDLYGCFNLNALKGAGLTNEQLARRKVQMRMLLLAAVPDMQAYTADTIVESLADWLDKDDRLNSSYGAESADYESLEVPYQAANDYFVHESELRLVRGVTQPIYQALKPFVCVVPNTNKLRINFNTVAAEHGELLHAISLGGLTTDAGNSAISQRPDEGYERVEDVLNNSIVQQASQQAIRPDFGGVPKANGVTAENIGGMFDDLVVKSNYFELDTHVSVGDMVLRGQSKLYISDEETVVLMRGLGEP